MIDLVYVTYNSEKWITQCFDSILDSTYDLKQVNIFVVDNASADKTVDILQSIKDDMLEFSAVIEEIQTFLEPVFEAIVNEDEWQGEWESNISRWSHLGGGIDHDKSN